MSDQDEKRNKIIDMMMKALPEDNPLRQILKNLSGGSTESTVPPKPEDVLTSLRSIMGVKSAPPQEAKPPVQSHEDSKKEAAYSIDFAVLNPDGEPAAKVPLSVFGDLGTPTWHENATKLFKNTKSSQGSHIGLIVSCEMCTKVKIVTKWDIKSVSNDESLKEMLSEALMMASITTDQLNAKIAKYNEEKNKK